MQFLKSVNASTVHGENSSPICHQKIAYFTGLFLSSFSSIIRGTEALELRINSQFCSGLHWSCMFAFCIQAKLNEEQPITTQNRRWMEEQ